MLAIPTVPRLGQDGAPVLSMQSADDVSLFSNPLFHLQSPSMCGGSRFPGRTSSPGARSVVSTSSAGTPSLAQSAIAPSRLPSAGALPDASSAGAKAAGKGAAPPPGQFFCAKCQWNKPVSELVVRGSSNMTVCRFDVNEYSALVIEGKCRSGDPD